MSDDKEMLVESLAVLIEKSEDISALAHAQRVTADQQHETAHRLEKLGQDLEAGAARIQDELRDAEKKAKAIRSKEKSTAGDLLELFAKNSKPGA
jgi:hypothetical protein